MNNEILITIIMANYNSGSSIKRCLESISNQKNKKFQLLIADGKSNDESIDIIRSYQNKINMKIYSEKDNGIYDALNKLIKKINTKYYVVIGADDYFYSNAIDLYESEAKKDLYDLITFPAHSNNNSIYKPKGFPEKNSALAYVSQHCVGILFRTSIHDDIGLYSTNLGIGNDHLFIMNAINSGYQLFQGKEYVGFYANDGASAIYQSDPTKKGTVQGLFEYIYILLYTQKNFILTYFFVILRLIFWFNRLRKVNKMYFKSINEAKKNIYK